MVLWMVAWNRFHSSDTGSLTSFLSLPTFRFNPGYPYRFNFFSSFTLSSFPLERKIKKFEIDRSRIARRKPIDPSQRSKLSILIKIKNTYMFRKYSQVLNIYIYREEIKIKYNSLFNCHFYFIHLFSSESWLWNEISLYICVFKFTIHANAVLDRDQRNEPAEPVKCLSIH